MLKFKIHYNGSYDDEIVVSGETMEELKEIVFSEITKRGWKEENCWSERLDS